VNLSSLNGETSGFIELRGKLQWLHRVLKGIEVVSPSSNGKLSGSIEFKGAMQ